MPGQSESVVIRVQATKKLLERLTQEDASDDGITSPLGDWYATAIFSRPQLAVLMNESTMFPILMLLAPAATIVQRIPLAIEEALSAYNLPAGFIDDVVAGSNVIQLEPTSDRSLVAALNQHVQFMKRFALDAANQRERLLMIERMAQVPKQLHLDRPVCPDLEVAQAAHRWLDGRRP